MAQGCLNLFFVFRILVAHMVSLIDCSSVKQTEEQINECNLVCQRGLPFQGINQQIIFQLMEKSPWTRSVFLELRAIMPQVPQIKGYKILDWILAPQKS